MHVMFLQLEEMKSEHLLKEQPILLLNQPELRIEAPRFFYSPPEDQFSFQSRYHLNATLINASDDPAIIISIVANIKIPQGDKELVLYSRNNNLNFSSAKNGPSKINFMFLDDFDGILFNAIRDRKTIKINTTIYYQNTSGACFSLSNTYRFSLLTLIRRAEIEFKSECNDQQLVDYSEIVKSWHTAIIQAPTKYKEELQYLKEIVHSKKSRAEYKSRFYAVKDDFSLMLSSKENLECFLYEDSDAFKFGIISKDDFDKYTDNHEFAEAILSKVK